MKIELEKQEVKLLIKVLEDGMPENQVRRDKIAKIWNKLKYEINTH